MFTQPHRGLRKINILNMDCVIKLVTEFRRALRYRISMACDFFLSASYIWISSRYTLVSVSYWYFRTIDCTGGVSTSGATGSTMAVVLGSVRNATLGMTICKYP